MKRRSRKPRRNDLGAAMLAISRALGPFDVPTSAMATCGMAGVFAAQGRNDLHRVAGLGANLETMVTSYNEAVAFSDQQRKKRQRRRAKR